jgi:hypothetical protein
MIVRGTSGWFFDLITTVLPEIRLFLDFIFIFHIYIYIFINTHTGDSFDLKFSKKSEPWLIYTGNVWQESPHGALVDHLCFFVELISQKNKYIHSKLITILF